MFAILIKGFIASSKLYRPHLDDSYFKQCFEVEAKLGEGSFGEVFRVRSKEDGKVYACKRTLFRFRGERDRYLASTFSLASFNYFL